MILLLTCGVPAGGKTTFAKKLAKDIKADMYSYDELQCRKYDDLIPYVAKSLKHEKNVIVDAVFGMKFEREQFIRIGKQYEYCCKIALARAPLIECLRRNRNRERKLCDSMIVSIYHSIEIPKVSDGWDEIIYI